MVCYDSARSHTWGFDGLLTGLKHHSIRLGLTYLDSIFEGTAWIGLIVRGRTSRTLLEGHDAIASIHLSEDQDQRSIASRLLIQQRPAMGCTCTRL